MEKEKEKKEEPVAQRQEMVFGILALLSHFAIVTLQVSCGPEGDKDQQNKGGVCMSMRQFLGHLIGSQECSSGLPELPEGWLRLPKG